MIKKEKKQRLVYSILRLSVLPITILGIILTAYSQSSVREGMIFEVEKNLSGIAHNLISLYNMMDTGDFSYEDGRIMKGETDFTSDYRLLDDVKNDTGADVTIFIGDVRCLTTLVNKEGKRLTRTRVNDVVRKIVLEDGEDYFSQNVDVVGASYFGYYVPIRNDEGRVIGISFAGKSVKSIHTSINYMMQGNLIICLFVILLAGFLCNISAQRMVATIHGIKNYLARLAHGDFSHKMPEQVLERKDELGEMGEYALSVGYSLEEMVSRDPLTKLLNRRAGRIQLEHRMGQKCFTIVMGDIDFFKNVNDTYGHEMGDEVLCYIAGELREMVSDIGFCVRWGGEEFLIGYDGEASFMQEMLYRFQKTLQKKKFCHEKKEFTVTMTFGVAEYGREEDFEKTIERADELLYYGKEHGRNQIVMDSVMAGAWKAENLS